MGKGPGNSDQRNFLPQAYNDMIYAIICEEYGLWGALLIFLTAKAPVKTRYYWEKKIFTNPVAGIAAKKVNNAIGE